MWKKIKRWLEIRGLKYPTEVYFDYYGHVIDVKGLQHVSGEIGSEEAVYKISKKWKGWDYFGDGLYCYTAMGRFNISRDPNHPKTKKSMKKVLDSFNKLKASR